MFNYNTSIYLVYKLQYIYKHMSLLSSITHGDSPEPAKCLAHLIAIVRALGWESLMDPRHIKPNIRSAQLYIRKHAKELSKLYGISFYNIEKNKVVDTINPLLIHMWHIQIVGDTNIAYLELLQKIS